MSRSYEIPGETDQTGAVMANPAASEICLGSDVTELWNSSHAHLLPRVEYVQDRDLWESASGAHRGLRIRTRLRFGPDFWIHDGEVLFLPEDGRFVLPATLEAHYQMLARGWAVATNVRPESYVQVTAVDARLWSATPTFLNIEPTTRCNFNCWYCIGRHMKQEDISFENFSRTLDNFPSLKVIAIVGEGEPLLHKKFFDMVQLAVQRGIKVFTLSNGSTFSNSVIKKICESGLTYISVSVDSIDPDTFASSRIDGNLEKVWDGIKRLAEYRDSHGFKYPRIALKGSLFEHTQHEMIQIIEEAKRRGVDFLESFQPLNPKQTYVNFYPKDKLELLRSYAEIQQSINLNYQKSMACAKGSMLPGLAEFEADENLNLSNLGKPNGLRKNCDEEWVYSLLSGDVTPCCQIKTPMDRNWNIFDHGIDEILNDEHYQNVRFNLWNGIFLPECKGCWKTC